MKPMKMYWMETVQEKTIANNNFETKTKGMDMCHNSLLKTVLKE